MKSFFRPALLSAVMLTALAAPAQAQQANHPCAESHARSFTRSDAKSTIADPAEEAYDVQYVKFNLALTNTSTAILGDVTTRAKVTAASMSGYVFELNPQLTIDSCKVNGSLRTFTTSGTVRTVSLPSALTSGALFTAQVFYHGTPASGSGFNTYGINNQWDNRWHTMVTYTVSEAYQAADWWPCKMALHDKIDSSDIWLTVADTLMAGSNGILQAVTPLPGNRRRYEWKHREPINYYLLSASVANYTDYSFYAHYSGSSDSTLVKNYVYAVPNSLTYYKPMLDSVGAMMDYFSTLFGRYPFWREKYGHCFTPLYGGQEHQTMTTIGNLDNSDFFVLPHELSHQWWGDDVTCGSFSDIWLNEGFASYCEDLFYEHFDSRAQMLYDLGVKHRSVMDSLGGSVYVYDTSSGARIFDSRLTYYKGASVVHMLRYLAGSDSLFFRMLRMYRQQYGRGVAYTPDLKGVAQAIYGKNLDSFFRQWVYGEGYPTYGATINQRGSLCVVHVSQTTSKPASVAAFNIPVQVRCMGVFGDTVVTVPMNGAQGLIYFQWNKPFDAAVIDPNDWIPNKLTGISVFDSSLGIGNSPAPYGIAAVPNPAHDLWNITRLPAGCAAFLTDANGRIIARYSPKGGTLQIAAETLPAGLYLLHVAGDGDRKEEVIRLLRN